MNIGEIKKSINNTEYSFLRTNPHLKNIILLGIGGSHGYGTNTEDSDVDLRGCALNSKEEILLGNGFEQVSNNETDTVIYSFNKLIHLLTNVNPNTIEILGLKPEHYLKISDIGQELLDKKSMFLSKRAIYSFGGYALAQFRRLDNKAGRLQDQAKQEQHILNSIQRASETFSERYFPIENKNDYIHLRIDDAVNKEYTKEIFMDVHLTNYPLRDYKCMWSEMNNIVKDYSKIGKRNKNAIEHGKLGKHMMHLIRLYLMCIDILERKEIITYREKEHDLLMSIRNEDKEWIVDNQPTEKFLKMVDWFERRVENLKRQTRLPDNPDYKAINDFAISVNERIVKGERR